MIHAYLDHLRVERRLAEHTLESYARDLRALAAFAARRGGDVERSTAMRSRRSFASR